MDCECFFCEKDRFSLNKSIDLVGEESIIYEDENVFIIPDIAPLLPGHFLIVTQKHWHSFGNVDDNTTISLEKAKKYLRKTIFKDESILFFEHGAVIQHSAGACIDHAHMHVIPISFDIDIDEYIHKSGFISSEKRFADKESLMLCAKNYQPYIYYETSEEERWYYQIDILPSQFFRLMIASRLSTKYNWKIQYKMPETKELFNKTLKIASNGTKTLKLCDIGEKNIVQNIIYKIFPHLHDAHDDAVIIDTTNLNQIVLSTDPCPEPVVNMFDPTNKYYNYGRMSVLINYSDIAADGAVPIGILLSTTMENSMPVSDYEQFLVGVKESCREWGGQLLGGNIKEGREFSVTGTSIGKIEIGAKRINRVGTCENDIVCVVGDLGMFWLAVLKLWKQDISLPLLDDYTKSFLLNPRPKLSEGAILSRNSSVTACMDSSDGIIGCLYEFAELNDLTIFINDEMLIPNKMLLEFCVQNNYDYRTLMLSWGGWELVFTCNPNGIDILKNDFQKNGHKFSIIGTVKKKEKHSVILSDNQKMYSISDFSSKRFDRNSYMTFGIEKYIEQLRENQYKPI